MRLSPGALGGAKGGDDRPRWDPMQRSHARAPGRRDFLPGAACARLHGVSVPKSSGARRSLSGSIGHVHGERNRTGLSLGVSLVLHVVLAVLLWTAPRSFP